MSLSAPVVISTQLPFKTDLGAWHRVPWKGCPDVLSLATLVGMGVGGFMWQGFGSQGGHRGGFYEKNPEAAPC